MGNLPKRSLERCSLGVLGTLFAISVWASPEVKSLREDQQLRLRNYPESIFPIFPQLQAVGNKLIVADTLQHSIEVLGDTNGVPRVLRRIPTRRNMYNGEVAIDPSGRWAAVCAEVGNKIVLVELAGKKRTLTLPIPLFKSRRKHWFSDVYELERTSLRSCFGIDLDVSRDGKKLFVWAGDTGARSIALVEVVIPSKSKTLSQYTPFQRFNNISGPFYLDRVGSRIFTVNGVQDEFAAMPMVYDFRLDKAIVGDRLGKSEKTSLTREYNAELLVDRIRDEVHYLKSPKDGKGTAIVSMSLSDPREDELREFELPILALRQVDRYKNCLIVMGLGYLGEDRTETGSFDTMWAIVKAKPEESLKLLRIVGNDGMGDLGYGIKQAVDSSGNVFIASVFRGTKVRLTRIQGLTEGLSDCQ